MWKKICPIKSAILFVNRIRHRGRVTMFYPSEVPLPAISVAPNAQFLDRQNVDCGSDGVFMSFAMEVNTTETRLRYVYECCRPQVPLHCTDLATEIVYAGNYQTTSLTNHNVVCPQNQVLQRFAVGNVYSEGGAGSGSNRYVYRCCRF